MRQVGGGVEFESEFKKHTISYRRTVVLMQHGFWLYKMACCCKESSLGRLQVVATKAARV